MTRKRELRSLLFNAASTLADRHQIFASASLVSARYRDEFEDESATRMSDTLLGYNFELPPRV